MFEVGFELVSSTMPNVMVSPTELPGVKDRSITQPRVSLLTFSPPWNSGIFGTCRMTGLRMYTVVRVYPNFDPNPGDPGRHVYNKTHAQAFLLKEMFEVGFELVSFTPVAQ